jgi:hypothetical protein
VGEFEVKRYEAFMFSPFIRSIVLSATLASAAIAAHPGTALARTSYDGTWSVLIITNAGACDRAYRYGIRISNGYVVPEGGVSVDLQGRVAHNGAVRVSVSAGGQRADGSGRLYRESGSGLWRGQGPSGTCAGTWQAERRE